MPVKFSNNAATTLAANVTNSATTITVADGSVFPTLAGTDFTFITLEDVDSNREIVKLTAVSSNTLTIVRAQDGSSARAYSTNDKVELRLTAALLNAAVDSGAADLELNVFSGTGSQVNFTLSTQAVEANTLAYIDGVYQNKSGYSISGYVLTFSAAPDNGATIEVTCATVAPIQESTDFLISTFTGNNSTTAFSLSNTPTSENQCSVYISGVYQSKANFSVSGSTLTFSTAPPNGSAIEVMVARTVVYAAGTPDNNTVSTVKIQDDAVTSAKVDGTVATVAGTETLTNKTLTAPDINTPDIDGGTIDGAVIGGATAAAISGTTGTFSSTVRAVGTTLTSASSATLAFTGTTSRLESRGADVSTRGAIQLMQATSNGSNEIVALGIDAAGLATFNDDVVADAFLPTTSGAYGSNHVGVHSGGVVLNAATSQTGYIMSAGSAAMTFAPTGATIQLGGLGAANKLDDYEEGNWTPVVKSGATVIAITMNFAKYTKIGNTVYVTAYVTRADSASLSGIISIYGLPFTVLLGAVQVNGASWFDTTGTDEVATNYFVSNSVYVQPKKVGASSDYVTADKFQNGRPIYLSGTYMTS